MGTSNPLDVHSKLPTTDHMPLLSFLVPPLKYHLGTLEVPLRYPMLGTPLIPELLPVDFSLEVPQVNTTSHIMKYTCMLVGKNFSMLFLWVM